MANAKWTVMVYMAAGDGADLDAHAVSDLQEMERANVGPDVNVVVQINRFWPAKPQRYQIAGGQTTLVRADIVDDEPIEDVEAGIKARGHADGASMGSGETLDNFMRWSHRHYPADRYFLVLWGHAYGLGFGRDHGEPMTLNELKTAIHTFRQDLPLDPATKERPQLDLLGANACAISYAEAACELREDVRYLVASEIAVPFAGWPYEAILGCLSRGPWIGGQATLTAEQLGELVVDRYVSQFDAASSGERVAMSLLNLARATDLRGHVTELADSIVTAIDGTDKDAGERRSQIRSVFLATAAGDVRPLLDLFDLAERLDTLCQDLAELAPHRSLNRLSNAANALTRFLEPGQDAPPQAAQGAPLAPFVAYRRQHKELEGLHGVGIFAPFVTDQRDLKRLGLDAETVGTGRRAYEQLSLVSEPSTWASLVYDRLRSGLPEEVLAGIEGSGASSRADRAAVIQMLASIDSTFDALDRRIAVTRAKVIGNVPAVGGHAAAALQPEALNLLGRMQLLRHAEVDKMLVANATAVESARSVGGAARSTATPVWSGVAIGSSDQVEHTANAFTSLEGAFGTMERTIRRTLTNGTFGLGPGLGSETATWLGRDKDGMGALRDKDGMGGLRDKDGMGGLRDKDGMGGLRDKDGMGGLRDKDGMGASGSSPAEATPAAVIRDLFGQVGRALAALEAAGADAETIAAKALLAPPGVSALEPLSNATLGKARLERAFRVLAEASADLRRTLRRVVAHPTYGFGPGLRSVSIEDRRELARASGLSNEQLMLL